MKADVKLVNNMTIPEAYKFYARTLRLSVVPIVNGTPPIKYKTFIERLPTDTELEYFVEKYQDADGVGLILGYRGLLAFDIDGDKAKKVFWAKFKSHFGDYPENITWVEERICPKTHKRHYHVYIIYNDYRNTVPANGTKKLLKTEDGEICIVYNTFIRATPSFHEGSSYKFIHKDGIFEPLKVKKEDFLRFVEEFDPYYRFHQLENTTIEPEDIVVVKKLDKDLTDEQIEQVIEFIAESGSYPQPNQGRGLFFLGLAGLLAFLGVKEDSCIKLVERIFERLDPEKLESDKRRFITKVKATYGRIKENEPISYKSWFRDLGWTESEIDTFKNEIVKIVRPKPQEFIKKELGYIIDIKNNSTTIPIPVDGNDDTIFEPITIYTTQYKVVRPSKDGIFWLYTICETKVKSEDYEKIKQINIDKNKQLIKKLNIILKNENIVTNNAFVTLSVTKPRMERITFDRMKIEKVTFFGDIYVKLNARGHTFEGRIETVVKQLVEKGIVSKKYSEYFAQYLAWMSQVVQKEKAYTSTGIYVHNGKFVPAIPQLSEVYPLDPIAKMIYNNIEKMIEHVDYEKYKEFLNAIHTYKHFLPKQVYYVVFGFMGIAPFLHALVTFTGLKPALMIIGGKGSGKTTLARFVTKTAFGVEELRQDVFDTAFRQGIVLSSTTLPLLIDDVDKWSGSNIGKLKATLTGTQIMIRGKPSGDVVTYEEKASFVVTANYNVFEKVDDPAILDRLIIVELQRKIDIKEKIEFAKKLRKFANGYNFGYYLIGDLVELANILGLNGLVQKFEEYRVRAYEKGIIDGRDPEKFAILMLGLLLLHGVLIKNGLNGFDLDDAEEHIATLFTNRQNVDEIYPLKLVNLVVKIHDLIESEDEVDEEMLEKFGVFLKENNVCITTKTLTMLRSQQTLELPRSLSEVSYLLKDVFQELRNDDLYKVVKHNGYCYRVVAIPRWVFDEILGQKFDYDDGTEEDKNNNNGDDLDGIDKQIIDIAKFCCEAVPNPRYQVDLFVKQIKANFTHEIGIVENKIKKLIECGKLQSHFIDAIKLLKSDDENKSENNNRKNEREDNNFDDSKDNNDENELEFEKVIKVENAEDMSKIIEKIVDNLEINPDW